ncbi:MAG: hypothetical protein K9K76_09180 [Halanaerobiales bacterium]|nr:hypothetical protein [Halanaerobiales bacterium]
MIINKKFRNITSKDLVATGVYDGVDFDKHKEAIEQGEKNSQEKLRQVLDKGNQILKQSIIKQDIEMVRKYHKKIDPEFNLITTDYFKNDIEDILTIIGSRTVGPGPEKVKDKMKSWFFKGYITFIELRQFPGLYKIFRDLYSEYKSDDWKLELNVVGGIMGGNLALTRDSIEEYRDIGVMIEPWGFDGSGEMVSFSEILVNSHMQMKKKAERIREAGSPKTLDEARTLKLDDEGKQLFSKMFY